MRTQKFGIEIEMTGITRAAAAQVIAGHFDTTAIHVGGMYDAFSVRDGDSRQWKVVSDSSILRESRRGQSRNAAYAVEFVSPICKYEDIETIQELIRKLRTAGAKVNDSCGIHIHVDASPHDVKTLRNIVNIMAAKEDLLYKTLKVNVHRQHYCAKADRKDKSKSQSEFIDRAIRYYAGHVMADEDTSYLPNALLSNMKSVVAESDNRHSKMLFKLAVEMAVMMNVVAASNEIDEISLARLRGECIQEVKRLNGNFSFEDAVEWQS